MDVLSRQTYFGISLLVDKYFVIKKIFISWKFVWTGFMEQNKYISFFFCKNATSFSIQE